VSKKQQLNFRFHNPNTPKETADFLLKLFVETDMDKLNKTIAESCAGTKESNAAR
jgi:hypothetical protein